MTCYYDWNDHVLDFIQFVRTSVSKQINSIKSQTTEHMSVLSLVSNKELVSAVTVEQHRKKIVKRRYE